VPHGEQRRALLSAHFIIIADKNPLLPVTPDFFVVGILDSCQTLLHASLVRNNTIVTLFFFFRQY
jgi:hypothetical protein